MGSVSRGTNVWLTVQLWQSGDCDVGYAEGRMVGLEDGKDLAAPMAGTTRIDMPQSELETVSWLRIGAAAR